MFKKNYLKKKKKKPGFCKYTTFYFSTNNISVLLPKSCLVLILKKITGYYIKNNKTMRSV